MWCVIEALIETTNREIVFLPSWTSFVRSVTIITLLVNNFHQRLSVDYIKNSSNLI